MALNPVESDGLTAFTGVLKYQLPMDLRLMQCLNRQFQ
jgi:hypothetical protein